jgi:chromosome segregation ATPase
MKFIEPAFDPEGEFSPRPLNAPHRDISALENTIARQSSELNLRLAEVLELYSVQSRHTDELQTAHEEIDRLEQTISALQSSATQQRMDSTAAQDKIACLENDKAVLRAQLNQVLDESKTLAGRLRAMQTAFDARETNVASVLEQVDYLNSELATAAAERFRLVATVHGEKRRHNQQTSIWENRIKKTEARVENQEAQIKHLETVRCKLDKRIQVLEALLKSEHEVAERKIKRLTEELARHRSESPVADSYETQLRKIS